MKRKFWVRMAFEETCYVERDFLVQAESEEQAIEFAKEEKNVIDEGEDHQCSPEGRDNLRLALDYDDDPQVSEEMKPETFPDVEEDA